jgi:tetratricopeptide (TPR) repeat protein
MSFDISQLLDQWEYQPGKLSVRRFTGKDGVEKLQLRIDLGVMQLNATGRPDGKRPYGHTTLLEHFQAQQARLGDSFRLAADDCARLQQEAIQFHHRYICLFQLGDYPGVIRDTERNLEALEFLAEHAPTEELLHPLRQFLPQLLMLQTRARGTLEAEAGRHASATEAIEAGIEAIRTFYREQGHPEWSETSNELHSLTEWLEELRSRRPLTEREKLENALREAVAAEDYEKAAQVRDALRNIR